VATVEELERVLKDLADVPEILARLETKLDTVIERTREDRARISVNTENITALRIEQGKIVDRQRGLAALSGVLATVISTAAAVTVSLFGAKS
jgi:hypothetical protein